MGKQNKRKCCKTCVWWQVKKTRPEDEVEGQKVITTKRKKIFQEKQEKRINYKVD